MDSNSRRGWLGGSNVIKNTAILTSVLLLYRHLCPFKENLIVLNIIMARKRTKIIAPTPFSEKITFYRKERGWTVKELGQKLGVTESYASYLETGARNPSRNMIFKLSEVFFPEGNPGLLNEWLVAANFAPIQSSSILQPHDFFWIYEQKLNQNQLDFKSQMAFIRLLIQSGHFERAKRHIQKCLGLFQHTVQIQTLIGSMELAQGNFGAAITAQEAAIKLYQQQPPERLPDVSAVDLLLSLGVSHFLKGYQELAQYQQIKPSSKAKEKREQTLASFETAQQQFKQALAVAPQDIYVLDEYARVLFNMAHLHPEEKTRWHKTINAFKQVLHSQDNDILGRDKLLETAVFLGHAYAKIGQFSEAEHTFHLLRVCCPEQSLLYYALACCYSLRFEQEPQELFLTECLAALKKAFRNPAPSSYLIGAEYDPDLQAVRKHHPEAFLAIISVLKEVALT